MEGKIRVLLVDDVEETRVNIKKLFFFAPDIEVVGEGANGVEALQLVDSLKPDLILIDINMPVMDGIEAIEKISLYHPACCVVVMSVQGEQEYLRRAMSAGARDYLVKPFSSDDLINTTKRVYELESKRKSYLSIQLGGNQPSELKKQVITVFSSKGGVGKSTIATNLGTTLAKSFGRKAAILDLDLQFGDVALMLNLIPRRTMVELIQEEGSLDEELLDSYLLNHESGLRVLPGPQRPEQAELIGEEQIGEIIRGLKESYDYLIIDTPPSFHDGVLTALDHSNQIFLVTTSDLPTVKNIKLCLEVLASLHYPWENIKLIVNKFSKGMGLDTSEVKDILGLEVSGEIVSDDYTAINAANQGIPFTLNNPQSPISLNVRDLAERVLGLGEAKEGKKSSAPKKALLEFFRRPKTC